MRKPTPPLPHAEDTEVVQLLDAWSVQERRNRQIHDAEREVTKSSKTSFDHVAAAGTPITIFHHLGRLPVGWRLIDLYSAALLTSPVRRLLWDNEKLLLFNDNAAEITIRVEIW